mmetsp:Transcript_72822/g.236591  ORF Transcript_72822/g.236591 Transcript_72822/m.236591 type:complete len:288 (+) Transcript_72822:1238-2101(+)
MSGARVSRARWVGRPWRTSWCRRCRRCRSWGCSRIPTWAPRASWRLPAASSRTVPWSLWASRAAASRAPQAGGRSRGSWRPCRSCGSSASRATTSWARRGCSPSPRTCHGQMCSGCSIFRTAASWVPGEALRWRRWSRPFRSCRSWIWSGSLTSAQRASPHSCVKGRRSAPSSALSPLANAGSPALSTVGWSGRLWRSSWLHEGVYAPHRPDGWRGRAHAMRQLGLGELAVGALAASKASPSFRGDCQQSATPVLDGLRGACVRNCGGMMPSPCMLLGVELKDGRGP